MKAIKRLLAGIGLLLVSIFLSIVFYNASGIWMYGSLIILVSAFIGTIFIIVGIFTKD